SARRRAGGRPVGMRQMTMAETGHPPSGLKAAASFIASRFRDRPDREHEMVINRLAISTLLMIYLAVSSILHTMEVRQAVIANAVYGLISLGFFTHMLIMPRTCHTRRIIGMCVDIGALTYCLYVGGGTTAVLFPIYLWIIFGNGFRFGLRYLFASMSLALIGFGLLLWTSPYWSATGHLGIGLLVGLLALPAYTSTLISNLNKAKRQAEEASKAKTQFMASVSHELRTPLNAVIGMSDLLRDSRLDAEQSDMISTISSSARSLLSLIEGILDFSRIEAGRMRFETIDFDLHRTLTAVRNMLEAQARAKGLRLGLYVTPRTPYLLRGDGRHLQEILVNLVGNAVKFTASGRVVISADLVATENGKSRIRFEVSDTGIGISPEATSRIFERFTQADETILNRFGGTGLGLAICRQLAEALGGSIGVDSVEGAGSTFWLELAFEPREEEAPRRLEGLRFLVLSTDQSIAPAIGSALEETGASVAAVASAEDAENELSAGRRTLLMIDERLPDCDLVAQRLAGETGGKMWAALIGSGADNGPLPQERRAIYCAALNLDIDRAELLAAANLASGQSRETDTIADAAARSIKRSLSVLVAEDNGVNQKVITKILERAGHRVRIAENGERAVDLMLAEKFDIVLMDVNMPVMNGIEATKLYRFAALGRERLPIVALTADATAEARAGCEAAGMDACATKPIDAAELFRVIDSLVPEDAGERVEKRAEIPATDDIVADIAAHPRFRLEARAIDTATIEQLQGLGGADFVADLAGVFVREGERIVEELKASVESGDCQLFRDRMHALRSGAANIGALPLYQLCLSLRGIGAADFAEEGAEKARQIEAEFARVSRELRENYCGAGDAAKDAAAPTVIRPLRAAAGRSSGDSAPS
ncbi:MAG: ATP-binding protein, partial [Propylenella sp.]